jgi:transposase-like protein
MVKTYCLLGVVVRRALNIRGLQGRLAEKGLAVTRITDLFDTTRQTVHRWLKRARHVGREYFKDKPRTPKSRKVTADVEVPILALRKTFKWGTARIQQGLYRLSSIVKEVVHCVQGTRLLLETANNISNNINL